MGFFRNDRPTRGFTGNDPKDSVWCKDCGARLIYQNWFVVRHPTKNAVTKFDHKEKTFSYHCKCKDGSKTVGPYKAIRPIMSIGQRIAGILIKMMGDDK